LVYAFNIRSVSREKSRIAPFSPSVEIESNSARLLVWLIRNQTQSTSRQIEYARGFLDSYDPKRDRLTSLYRRQNECRLDPPPPEYKDYVCKHMNLFFKISGDVAPHVAFSGRIEHGSVLEMVSLHNCSPRNIAIGR
jgi:hypothetical protein